MIRLKKLEIRNLLSLETATIDFDEDIGESGLVLICGKTGAGKSTILDAICLALYGRAPRLERAGSEEKYGPNNEYKNRDVAQLMRRGAVDAYCSLTFVTPSGDEYETSWEIHRARRQHNGAIQGPNRTLSKVGGDRVEKGVKGAIEEVVGLSYDDFCQTVLLAQGDFSRFLYSSEGERSSILERLTRMEQCTEYGKKIYRIADHYKQKYQRQRLAIDAIQTLSPDDVRKTKAQIRTHTQSVKSRNGEITALSELKTRLAKLSDLEDALGKYATDRTRLEGLFAGLLTAEKQLTDEAEARKEEMGRLDEEIARCSAAIPMYDREEQIVQSLTKLRGIWSRIEEIKGEKKADRKSLADLRPKQKAKLQSIRELDAQVAKLTRQVEVKEGEYDGYHSKEISDRIEVLRDQERFNVLQQSVLESKASLDKLQGDLEKLAADLEVAEEVLKRDEELKKKAEDAAGDAAKRLRQGLYPGDLCPVLRSGNTY
ncbi:SMC family ATPase [uncultured Porphyromonas sp.]|uniref:AAA family ATPase n=1 Tax=uncultured Porphyromonas sp. TaxID=159274 RepID=UPI002617D7D8|nr:SMC family ATPase [uncultured Porphyromonas sp.]